MKPATPVPSPTQSKSKKSLKVSTEVDASTLPPDADFEDLFIDFWKRNGGAIVIGVIVATVGILGFQIVRYVMDKREASMSAEYGKATDAAGLQAFAAAHPNSELAGLAYFRLANLSFESGKFSDAVSQYDQAATSLADSPFVQRAALSKGVALIRSGKVADGVAALLVVSDDTSAFDSTRGEAAYTAAIGLLEEGDVEGARKALTKIDALKQPGIWGERASDLKERERRLIAIE